MQDNKQRSLTDFGSDSEPPSQRNETSDVQTAPLEDNPNRKSSDYDVSLTDDLIEQLNEREQVIFTAELSEFAAWALTRGKNPEEGIGLNRNTVDNYISRLDQIYRLYDGLKLQISHTDANDFCEQLKADELGKRQGGAYSVSSKRKFNDALRKYFEWRATEKGEQSWEPPYTFEEVAENSPDNLTKEERKQLRRAAIKFDTLPSYSDVSPSQRDEIYTLLAQKIGKPKEELTPDDWEAHNTSWEKPSLIWISLDAGLRPIEIKRAKVGWVRSEKQTIYIPREDSAKGREHWECALREKTAKIASLWREERRYLERYRDTDHLWLTRENNPWESSSLNDLLDRLFEEANLDQTNRSLSWYSLRHSVGQYMTEIGGLHQAKSQLRHRSFGSTLRYQNPSVEQRQDTLNEMG